MRAIANGAAADDPTRTIIDAVKAALTELDGYAVADMTEDVEIAELVGQLRSLVRVLLSVVES